MRTGEADCHDQFANWPRNDMVFARGVGHGRRATARVAPTEGVGEKMYAKRPGELWAHRAGWREEAIRENEI